MTYQTPELFELSPSTRHAIGRALDKPGAHRRKAAYPATEQIAEAQKARRELEAKPGTERVVCAAVDPEHKTNWTLMDENGAVLDAGTAGRDFGEHHTLTLAIGRAVKLVAPVLPEQPVCHLVVRVQDKTFGYVNRVGTAEDDGKGGKVRALALRAFKARVLLTVKRVDGMQDVARAVPAVEARAPLPAPFAAPNLVYCAANN